MNAKLVTGLSRGFIIISSLNLLYVTVLAFIDPQAVMSLVGVQLPNNDAVSSIRGVYGGVGLTITLFLLQAAVRDITLGLLFLCFLWGSYALSRLITILREGELGAFGNQWLLIEGCFFMVALLLLIGYKNTANRVQTGKSGLRRN